MDNKKLSEMESLNLVEVVPVQQDDNDVDKLDKVPGIITNPLLPNTHRPPKTEPASLRNFYNLKHILHPVLGILLAMAQCLILSLVFLLVSYIKGISPLVVGNTRMLYQFVVSLPISIYCSDPILPPKKYAWPIFTRCLAGAVSVIFLMFAVSYAPISDASSIMNTSPIFVAALAWILLREKISLLEIALLLVIVVGAFFITRPAFIFDRRGTKEATAVELDLIYPKHYLGLVFAGASSLTASVAIVSMRKVSFLPLSLIVLDYSVVGMVLTTILCLSFKSYAPLPCNDNHSDDRVFLIVSALLGSVAQFFLYGALRYENAGIVSATTAMGIVFTFAFQIAFKGEMPPWTSWVGAGLITLSIAGLGLRKWYVSSNKKRKKNLDNTEAHPSNAETRPVADEDYEIKP